MSKIFIKIITLLIGVFITINLQAQNAQLSVQGIVKTIEGNAVENGDYDITFKIFNVDVGGTVLWQETIENVKVRGGIYSVVLGAGSTTLDVLFDEPYYLAVSVDGDVDLYPRARLTSAPYALALIGSDNIFPNSGNVGVGASSPQNKLTVQRGDGILGLEAVEDANNTSTITTTAEGMSFDAGGADKVYAFPNGRIDATADEQFTIEGTDTSQLVLTNTTGSATLGFDAAGGDDLKLSNPIGATKIEATEINLDAPTAVNGRTSITANGETLRLIGTDESLAYFYPLGESGGPRGFVGFTPGYGSNQDLSLYNLNDGGNIYLGVNGNGAISLQSYTQINGYKAGVNYAAGLPTSWAIPGYSHFSGVLPQTFNIGLKVSHNIQTTRIILHSDQRIKKDFSISNHVDDLNTLKKFRVTDYRHIDEIAHGAGRTKGFIAQEVKSIFPEAVNISEGFIPSIMESPTQVKNEAGNLIFTLANNHDLKVGDKVKIISDERDHDLMVNKILDNHTFSVAQADVNTSETLFVFGKKVDDFHSIDYDKIYTLNVSATQELARQVEALKKENAMLKNNATKDKQAKVELKAEVKEMDERLKNLESLMTATGQK